MKEKACLTDFLHRGQNKKHIQINQSFPIGEVEKAVNFACWEMWMDSKGYVGLNKIRISQGWYKHNTICFNYDQIML